MISTRMLVFPLFIAISIAWRNISLGTRTTVSSSTTGLGGVAGVGCANRHRAPCLQGMPSATDSHTGTVFGFGGGTYFTGTGGA